MIKRSMVRLTTLLFIAPILALTIYAQPTRYAVPREVPISRLVRQNFPGYFGARQNFPKLIPETFFPIGWSKEGKFAYYIEPVDEACGCYFAHLVIQDLRNDKVVWEFKYSQDDGMDAEGKMPPEDTIAKLWRKHGDFFSEKLREHNIVPAAFAMLPKTFTSRGKRYTAAAVANPGNDPDGQKRVQDLRITISSPGRGSKVLYKRAMNAGDDLYVASLDAGVIGSLKSPYEDRVAIVFITAERGWEGPPHTANIHITGADLTGGFLSAGNARSNYPAVWFATVNDPNKPAWEILPQEAKPGEVILSKRNELGIFSNFAISQFDLYGKSYNSVEGFWQMMLYPEGPDDERARAQGVEWKYTREQVAQMSGFEAKAAGELAEQNMKKLGIDWVTFEGKRFPYRSATRGEHYRLIVEAIRRKIELNPEAKRTLRATGELILRPDHHEEPNAPDEWKYYDILMQIRSELPK